jgi:hypothetical protein
MVLRMAGGLWIFPAALVVAVGVWVVVGDWIARKRRERRAELAEDPEVQLEAELQSWIRCLKVEYAAGDLTLEELEVEVERHLRLYNEARRPGERADELAVVDEIVGSQGRATGDPAQLQWARAWE